MNKKQVAEREAKIQHIMEMLSIDMDERGTFAPIHSESGCAVYRVDIDESGTIPVATTCQCIGHKDFYHYCTHMEAVDRFFARVYARPEIDYTTLSIETLNALRIEGTKKQKQLKREYQARTVAQQQADREAAVLQPRAFSILRAS